MSPVPVLLLQPMDQGTVVKAMKWLLIVDCIISVTVDIMLLVMSTEHVILVGIGLVLFQFVQEVNNTLRMKILLNQVLITVV